MVHPVSFSKCFLQELSNFISKHIVICFNLAGIGLNYKHTIHAETKPVNSANFLHFPNKSNDTGQWTHV